VVGILATINPNANVPCHFPIGQGTIQLQCDPSVNLTKRDVDWTHICDVPSRSVQKSLEIFLSGTEMSKSQYPVNIKLLLDIIVLTLTFHCCSATIGHDSLSLGVFAFTRESFWTSGQ